MNGRLFLLGLVICVLGILASLYSTGIGEAATAPYESFTIPLFIIGLVLIVLAALSKSEKHRKLKKYMKSKKH